MLALYFNPYPNWSDDLESSMKCIVDVAHSVRRLEEKMDLSFKSVDGDDSIANYKIFKGAGGDFYNIYSLLNKYKKHEKEFILWLLTKFSMGEVIPSMAIDACCEWVLEDIGASAPLLEFALKMDGISVTISDDQDWRKDQFSFKETDKVLPNVYGQDNMDNIYQWLAAWAYRNMSFQDYFASEYGIVFCAGALNTCSPNDYEVRMYDDCLQKAKQRDYRVDNNLIKIFKSNFGDILELRPNGIRMFFIKKELQIIVGGFYRKSESADQTQVGNKAAKRIKDSGYL